jgi:hypothetical protein
MREKAGQKERRELSLLGGTTEFERLRKGNHASH